VVSDCEPGRLLDLARRDSEVFIHGRNVGEVAQRIGVALGMPHALASRIRLAGLLHDIGKVALPNSVYKQATPLTPDEVVIVQRHPAIGESIVRLAGLDAEARWIRHHHERIDGFGYPDGLRGEEIPLASRVILVADALDAMTVGRPYRPARSDEEAFWELEAHAGSQFDADCVSALASVLAGDLRR
jgi:HD-GYP domain-containing protein (c-di-GMP phosphodiesterase class II)